MIISKHYQLGKVQKELDFADIKITDDTRLFIDPWLIKDSKSHFAQRSADYVSTFFQELLKSIGDGDDERAMELLSHLHEINWTRLGYSLKGMRGKAIAEEHADQILHALKASKAVKTKVLKDLEDTALLIPGIHKDKISDMITNIIMPLLIEFSNEQAKIHGMPLVPVKVPTYFWDPATRKWFRAQPFMLPEYNGKPVLLVPKQLLNKELAVNSHVFYNKYILEYEQENHFRNPSLGLCRLLKDGTQIPPSKKDLKPVYPNNNNLIVKYVNEHHELLERYKQDLSGKRTVQKRRKSDPLEG